MCTIYQDGFRYGVLVLIVVTVFSTSTPFRIGTGREEELQGLWRAAVGSTIKSLDGGGREGGVSELGILLLIV